MFSKECLNRGSVQNCVQIVVKPWHHRREAEGGRVLALSSLVVSKPGLHRRKVERGAQSQLVATKKLHHPVIVALVSNVEFTLNLKRDFVASAFFIALWGRQFNL